MFIFTTGFLIGTAIGVVFSSNITYSWYLLREKIKSFFLLFLLIFPFLQGCSSEPPVDPTVVLALLESNRATGIANAQFNARRYAASTYPGFSPQVRVDSTIQTGCPQGDGWASVDLVNDKNEKAKIKCSTYSATIECMNEKDFLSREVFNSQEGHCNPDIPSPLPKLTN